MAKINHKTKLDTLKLKQSGRKQPSQETVELRDAIQQLEPGRMYGFAYEVELDENADRIKSRISSAGQFLNKWVHAESVEDGSVFWVWVDPRPRQGRQKKDESV